MFQVGSAENHNILINQTLLLLGRNAMQVGRFFRNETGCAYRDGPRGREYVRYGVLGSPDIYGIIIGGRYIGLEGKTGNASQQENQVAFEQMVKKLGGFYFVFRSPDEALHYVLRAATS
jgi:hypothetical protein